MENTSEYQPDECDSCGFKTDALARYRSSRRGDYKHLCDFCASTFAGNALEYPEQYTDGGKNLQAICYVGNVLLAEIRLSKSN